MYKTKFELQSDSLRRDKDKDRSPKYTTAEIANFLGVSVVKLGKLIQTRNGPEKYEIDTAFGRKSYYSKDAVIKWWNQLPKSVKS